MEELYKCSPQRITDSGIPVFCEDDIYTDNYDAIAADLIKNLDKTGENPFIPEFEWKRMEWETIVLFKTYCTHSTKKVLDVGVGTGRLLSYIKKLKKDIELYGIDISLDMLELARNKCGVNVCKGKVEDLPYNDNTFDMIVCTDVLEHVVDLYRAVQELERTLKRGGVLIVRVPYKENLEMYLQKDYPYQFAHLRSFDEWEVKILFTKIAKMVFKEMRGSGVIVGRDNLIGHKIIPKELEEKVHYLLQRRFPMLRKNSKYLKRFYRPVEMVFVFRKVKG